METKDTFKDPDDNLEALAHDILVKDILVEFGKIEKVDNCIYLDSINKLIEIYIRNGTATDKDVWEVVQWLLNKGWLAHNMSDNGLFITRLGKQQLEQ